MSVFNKLTFKEVSQEQEQAFYGLGSGYVVQVIFDRLEGCYETKLTDGKGSMVDSGEGLDIDGVEDFITKSEELVSEYNEIMGEMNPIE